ncbi:MAG TPA: hypothetical protein VD972_25910, partial [Hyalangium sp.]|nr:hypothetical protein [Hyalangium sp.]
MAARTRSILVGLVALGVMGILLFLLRTGRGTNPVPAEGEATPPGTSEAPPGPAPTGARAGSSGQAPGTQPPAHAAAPKTEVVAELGWGSGASQLGRHRPQEASPEAPMSMAADMLGNVVVLDQINGRLFRLDPDGNVVGT